MNLKFNRACLVFAAIAIIMVAACQTKPVVKAPAAANESTIQAEAGGIAPTGDEHFKTINFALLFGNAEAVKTWAVSIVAKNKAVRTFSGQGADLPDSLAWDGKDDKGALAAEGIYTAVLAVDYGTAFSQGGATSKSFVLDISPPSASFSPNPAQFGYAPDGVKAPISITISAKPGLAAIAGWTMDIIDAGRAPIKNLAGAWPAASTVGWDGKTDGGGMVTAGNTYPATLTIRDEFGNAGQFKGAFTVANVPTAQPSSISARRGGFSPTSVSVKNTLDLLTTFGSKEAIVGWKLSVMSVAKGPIRTFTGDGTGLTDYSSWDGRDDAGVLAPEGSYYATLAIDYGKAYKSSLVKSGSFSLVTTPPTGSITVDPPNVTLASLGPKKPVNFTVQAKSAFAQIASWILAVYDPSNVSIIVFNGNWPNNRVAWDGKTVEGGTLIPDASYSVVAKVQDEYGNVGDLKGSMVVEGLVSPTEPSVITALTAGFAPTGDKSAEAMNFRVEIGNTASISAWRVDMKSADETVRRSFKGTGANVPGSLTWDGKQDDGRWAPEGIYTAQLQVVYGLNYSSLTSTSSSFILDLTPPSGTINLSTDLFSPDGEGTSDTVTISLDAASPTSKMSGWSMSILDPANNPFTSFKGDWSSHAVIWDGKGQDGDLVESASDYTIVARVRDEFGNSGQIKKVLPTDILVLKTADGYRIRVSSIVFKSFTADYKNVPPDRAARNLATLDLLAKKLARFPDYKIRLEGHAVMINWDNRAKGNAEQKAILIPLSEARAKAIEAALVERGIDVARMSSVGMGADNPVVPNSDYANRWKDRRVEFYLVK
ncbi:MAG: OmpA family protein [Rectinemataceae bacterium]|jgi:flagellar hook assembly protein FlgD